MERVSRNGEASQLLDFVAKEGEWLRKRLQEQRRGPTPPQDKALELKLGPPGDEDQSKKDFTMNYKLEKDESLLSLGYFNGGNQAQAQSLAPYLQLSPSIFRTQLPVLAKDKSSETVDLQNNNDAAEKKRAFLPASAAATTAVPNSSQKRTAPAPVVGWPPLRTFRKNLTSSDGHGKPAPKTHQNMLSSKIVNEKPAESSGKGLFVKMNMDGVPIGRKVDLNAYDSYEKLSAAVDELFRGLLAAQRDSSGCDIKSTQEEEKPITGLLDGRGEYTLVYEDYEGDRMLVGDVPWHMFISTVKRLRVLKSSEISVLTAGGQKQDKMSSDSAMQ